VSFDRKESTSRICKMGEGFAQRGSRVGTALHIPQSVGYAGKGGLPKQLHPDELMGISGDGLYYSSSHHRL
jgi:hypothetical protein